MLVDSVMVVHIELHHGDDASELRDEPTQKAGFVHPPQNRFRGVVGGQNIQKQRIGFGIGAQLGIDQPQGLRDQACGIGVDGMAQPIGQPKQFQEVDGLFRKNIRLGSR